MTNHETLRAGVIGAGSFGARHAEKYTALEGVRLAAILDIHPERASALAERLGARSAESLEGFFAEVDVVSIATPAASHARLALACLAAGKATYVEKPFALSLEDADDIIAVARGRGLSLACGFQERAALSALGPLPKPMRIEARRLNVPSERGHDISATLDLMSHDIDLAFFLGAGEPIAVEAEGGEDEARAEVLFEGGVVALFSVSRHAERPERALTLSLAGDELTIDLLANQVEGGAGLALDPRFGERPGVRDRLAASLAAFLAAARGEAVSPLAGGADGARALNLALAVETALGR
ncbi:MAG: Gfo/Idh/MocA family protein [Caulobacteraceae bacterium]